jgi:hypothetical protein
MSSEVATTATYAARDGFYSIHKKRGAPLHAPMTMRVDYHAGRHDYKSEWIGLEHTA